MAEKTIHESRDDGVALAIAMLTELECGPRDKYEICSFDPGERKPGTPQRNIVLEYLDRITSADMRAGFASVLSDYVAGTAAGIVTDSSLYEGVASASKADGSQGAGVAK